ncbi:MAG TPA: DUF2911 domain-containing protein [Longimicrobium sp.]|nr:DUF2911 domain-containing protein [Longimicrobium sp.]
MKIFAVCTSAAVLSLAAVPAPAQESAAFVVRLGRDTVAVERFTRTADRIEGTIVNRTPRTSVRTYTAHLRPDGTVSRLEMSSRVANDSTMPPQMLTITTSPDTAHWRLTRGDAAQEGGFTPGMESFPWIYNVFGLVEPVVRYARSRGTETVHATAVLPGALDSIRVVRKGADSVLIYSIPGIMRVHTDAQGRVLGAHSPESTLKVSAERLPSLDVMALAADFAAREQRGQGLGALSPRDSVVTRVDGAEVSVAYGRPAMRGRRIMGQVVPYGEVWRTGADDATHFRTDRDLMVRGTRVPAGSYTLWTVPGPDGWTLVVNSQTGQWGTEYDAARDFARIPVAARRTSDEPVELLTMRFDEPDCGEGATLIIEWEHTRVLVPFTVVR